MSEKLIPEHIDPFRFAEQSLHLDGVVKLADMPRLSTSLFDNQDTVTVKLHFGVDEQGINFIKGQLEAKLKLQCQRCMEPYTYEIMSNFVLGIVTSLDEANALPELYEPALAAEGSLALRELIEDEIMLNLPIIPRHENETCKLKFPLAELAGEQDKSENPFHVLKTLKQKDK
jgi:uncharacterized protein